MDECIIREVKEELGCSISGLKQLKTYLSFTETHKYLIVNYFGIISGSIQINTDEIAQIDWVLEANLDNYDFFPKCKDKILDFFTELKNYPKDYV